MADETKVKTDPTTMKWAIEQAVLLHNKVGMTTESLLAEARKIHDVAMLGKADPT